MKDRVSKGRMPMKLERDILRQVINLVAIVAAFGTNVAANVAPIKGLNIGEISNTLFKDVLIIPASYAFAIWGVIYLGLFGFAIYQALPPQRQNPHLRQIGYLLVGSSIAQIVWVVSFLSRWFLLSLVAMLGILLPLIVIIQRLGIGSKKISRLDKWLIQIPLSIYLAWISVATIVNTAIVLYHRGWNGWGISPQIWSAGILILAGVIAARISIVKVDTAFVLVYLWALIAIAVRNPEHPIIFGTAGIVAILVLLLLLLSHLRRPKIASGSKTNI